MSLRTKLALLISGLGMTMVLAMLLLVNQILLSYFRRAASEDVAGARELLAQSFAQSLDRYVIQGKMIADATLLKEALIRESPELAYTYADSARDQTSIASVVILDRKGDVLADAGGELARGSKIAQAGESSKVEAGFLTLGGALFAVAVVPVTIDRQIIGRVLVKDPMSAARLALVKQLSRSEVTLVDHAGRRLISTLPDQVAEQVPRDVTAEHESGVPQPVSISGESYLAAVAPLVGIDGDSLGWIVIARSLADQEHARKDLQKWLFALGIAFTLLAAAGGVAIGFRLSKPMRALTAAAMRLERGEVIDTLLGIPVAIAIPKGKDLGGEGRCQKAEHGEGDREGAQGHGNSLSRKTTFGQAKNPPREPIMGIGKRFVKAIYVKLGKAFRAAGTESHGNLSRALDRLTSGQYRR